MASLAESPAQMLMDLTIERTRLEIERLKLETQLLRLQISEFEDDEALLRRLVIEARAKKRVEKDSETSIRAHERSKDPTRLASGTKKAKTKGESREKALKDIAPGVPASEFPPESHAHPEIVPLEGNQKVVLNRRSPKSHVDQRAADRIKRQKGQDL